MICIVLTGCARGSFLHIQVYSSQEKEKNIGTFDIHFWRYSFDRFWGTINYDLKKGIILYKDSVNVRYNGHIKDVIIIDDTYRKDNPLLLSDKGAMAVRFYLYTQQGDTVMMYTKNAIYTSSGVLPIDSVRFIQGEHFKFKDNFVKRKGKTKYGYYQIFL
jgi:hypothetical protein